MKDTFPFGKYKRRTVEHVAFNDYSWLAWIDDKGIRSPILRAKVGRVRHILNNYTPETKCHSCGDIARYLSIAEERDGRGRSAGISVSTEYTSCKKEKCRTIVQDPSSSAMLYPIKFDTILNYRNKTDARMVAKVLLETTGFTGRKTQEALESLLSRLEKRPMSVAVPARLSAQPELF